MRFEHWNDGTRGFRIGRFYLQSYRCWGPGFGCGRDGNHLYIHWRRLWRCVGWLKPEETSCG